MSVPAISNAQVEGLFGKVKEFKGFGFGTVLNLGFPVSEGNYLTIEGGFRYLKNSDDEEVGIFPVLAGYRYTLDQSGLGWYVEPYAGYTFGSTTIGVYENDSPVSDGNGNWLYEKVAGPTLGAGLGYLFEPRGRMQFNLVFRYDHSFGPSAINMMALRLTHSFSFGRRDDY